MLTVVAAIAQQTARVSPDLDSFNEAFSGRLQSLAKAHQLLVGRAVSDVALTALVEQVLGADDHSMKPFDAAGLLASPLEACATRIESGALLRIYYARSH